MGEIILVRHGQANSAARDEASYDRLSALGAEQARLLGDWFRAQDIGFDRVLAGTLSRHRATAAAMDLPLTFSPLCAPDIVGNGVHIHLSLWDGAGRPVTHDPAGQDGLSAPASAFVGGVLRHLNAVAAFAAPSALSYLRLVPHRWSAAFNNLGRQDREAGMRICPVAGDDPTARARRFNVEMRAADAAASPYLALAAVVLAGTLGLEAGLTAPPATSEDVSLLSPGELARRGLTPLPGSLAAALEALEADALLCAALPAGLPAGYLAHKRGELAHVEGMTEQERFAAYARTY